MNSIQSRLWLSFIVAWIAYALTYFLRKPLGVIKTDLENDLDFPKVKLGLFDTALLLPYALVQTFFGSIGDRYGARRTLAYGLIGSGLAMITFGWWSGFNMFLLLLFLNGACQSLCWAAANKGLGAWVTDTQRNFIFGLFGTCPFAGGILGTAMAVYLQGKEGWRSVHFQPSILCIAAGFTVLILFREPSELKITIPGKESSGKANELRARMTIIEVFHLPMVKEIAVGVFCLKVVRYAIYLWLPLYFKQELNYSKSDAGLFSTMFEIGGIAGSATIGICLRKFFNNEGCVGAAVETMISAFTLLLFLIFARAGVTINSLLMIITGFLNCGADIILCGSVPTEIGEMDGRNAASAVIGFVNEFVIEVGPGPGGITRQLFEHGAGRVAAIEKDIRLFPALQTLANAVDSRLKLYHGDILHFNIESVIPDDISSQPVQWETDESLSKCPIHMIGNLPFNVAIPLLINWLKQVSTRSGPYAFGYRIPITICLQEDVAGRIVSDALMLTRGRLSILFQNWFDCRVKHIFSGQAFVPAARINVAVMQMIPLKQPLININFDLLDKVTRAAFHLRNRKLKDTLELLFPEETRDENTKELFERTKMKYDSNCLTLTVEEFGELAQVYGEIISRPRPIHEQVDRKINPNELTFELGETYVRPKDKKPKKKSKKDWDD